MVGGVVGVSGLVRVVGVSCLLVVRRWVFAWVLESLAWVADQSVASLVQADQQLAVLGR